MNGGALLRAADLGRDYMIKRRPLRAVDGVSLSLTPGRTYAVVGESGSGKSTLARLVTMIEPPSAGRLEIAGSDVVAADRSARRALRREVQMVFQDPYGSLNPRKKVRAIVLEPLVIDGALNAAERGRRAEEMIAQVGLRPEHLNRYPHMFSGGQRQRIAIARALMLRPRIVVADEPVSALDVSIQAQVLNLLKDLQDAYDLAYLFISHDIAVVRHMADELLVLYLGRPAEQGPAKMILARPAHPYTRALLASTPSTDPTRRGRSQALHGEIPSPLDPPSGCAFHTRCGHATDRCRTERPDMREIAGREVACHHAETVLAGLEESATKA
ncbi:MAG: dipeptide ABC transporter ATP-binding protein [Alphaproteobacteria bacterium]|nr:dipeptide ABC transporter ATP-binding protein [Alphaproteobacteria bacterium]